MGFDRSKSVFLISVIFFACGDLLYLPSLSSAAAEKAKESAGSLCGQADSLLNMRKLDQAWPLLQRAAKLEPNSAMVNLEMGRFYQLKCDLDNTGTEQKAIDCYSRAITAAPASGVAYRRRADMYTEVGEFDKAQRDILVALKLDANDSEANRIMTHLLIERKLYKDSVPYVDRWVALAPEKELCQAFLARASILDKLGLYPQEVVALRAAHAVKSNTVAAKNSISKDLATCLVKAGNLSEAEATYNSLVKSDPQDWELLASRSKVLAARGNLKGALADINGAITLEPSVKSLHQQREAVLARLYPKVDLKTDSRSSSKPGSKPAVKASSTSR